MERYFMLGNKDHQFFDITAAAYVRNFILIVSWYSLFATDCFRRKPKMDNMVTLNSTETICKLLKTRFLIIWSVEIKHSSRRLSIWIFNFFENVAHFERDRSHGSCCNKYKKHHSLTKSLCWWNNFTEIWSWWPSTDFWFQSLESLDPIKIRRNGMRIIRSV